MNQPDGKISHISHISKVAIVVLSLLSIAGCSAHSAMPPATATSGSRLPANHARNNGFGTFTQFAIPGCNDCVPTGMTLGRDNRMWFADFHGGTVGSIDTSGNFAMHNVDGRQQLLNYDVATS